MGEATVWLCTRSIAPTQARAHKKQAVETRSLLWADPGFILKPREVVGRLTWLLGAVLGAQFHRF